MLKQQQEYLEFVNKLIATYKIKEVIIFRTLLAKAVSKYDKENKENFAKVLNFLLYQFSTLSDEELERNLQESMINIAEAVKNT